MRRHFEDWWLQYYVGIIVMAGMLLWSNVAHSKWKPEYSKLPPEVQKWYREAELTPEAQKRIGYKGCCEHADVVEAKFNSLRVEGKLREEWFYQLEGSLEWKRIPDDIIWWGVAAPYGQATLFVYGNKETCFYPPSGGI